MFLALSRPAYSPIGARARRGALPNLHADVNHAAML
jgi:hypothetical protein